MTTAGPDVLLATKLEVPPPRPGLVRRPRLLERLAPETGCVATLVCAPAGCGKTSLLADWARAGGRPVAWLSLDAGDNDPVRFWRYVVAALDRAGPPPPSGWPRCWAAPTRPGSWPGSRAATASSSTT